MRFLGDLEECMARYLNLRTIQRFSTMDLEAERTRNGGWSIMQNELLLTNCWGMSTCKSRSYERFTGELSKYVETFGGDVNSEACSLKKYSGA